MIRVRNGSGKPPTGCPRYPWKNSTTEDGKSKLSARSRTSALESEFDVIHWAKSPTTLEEGVTYNSRQHCCKMHVVAHTDLDNVTTLGDKC